MKIVKHGPATAKVTHSQMVPAHMRGRAREVSSLVVDAAYRGHGYARALMTTLIEEADADGLVLLVVVAPFDDSPMDQSALQAWYERLGFVAIQADPLVMARQPEVMH